MIDANSLRKGVIFEMGDNLFKVKDYHHNKTARGGATIRIKAFNLRTGANIEKTFNSSERVKDIRLDYKKVQYLYKDDRFYYFMDNETYEQPAIGAAMVGDAAGYLKEGLAVKLTFFGTEPLDIDLPTSVELEVTQADIAVRGDTATGVTKSVTCETGLTVQCPNFVDVGDIIKVDTRTGEYLTRV
ncbi:MAG: elongation factor P [Anaerolineae bacterium]|jgi:elongation factor P|nr:elongation factor P [Anaerolineae bacterium]MBT3714903.1 elongation factor P [Anaerolineae bacterium]MBT4309777.1 elongation factor P [Anaerolineae bacterium]MBT4460080.1 elongation factor P [Anaerolineae bacterium]MBT4841327.1 elongation factor P [Anaerolineae bacterium]